MATLTPEQELAKLRSDNTFSGGTYYGRSPGGIVDLTQGGIGANQPGAIVPSGDPVIANSQVRRYTGDYTPPTSGTYASETERLMAERAKAGPAKDENTIRNEMRARVQDQIDLIKNTYAGVISGENVRGENRSGQTRAINARSGVLGQDFGNAAADKTTALNAENVKALENERDLTIQGILTKVDDAAYARAKDAIATADKNSTDYLAYLKEKRDATRTDVVGLAKSGYSLEKLTDEQYKKLLDTSGYTPDQLNSLFILNKPEDKTLTSFVQGNKYYVVSQDPLTGKKKTDTIDLGFSVPTNYQQTKLDDQTVLFYPDKFDPNKPIKEQIMTYQVGGVSLDRTKKELDIENQKLQNQKLRQDLTQNEPAAVTTDLQDAANAIANGADATKVRQRFLDSHPTKGDLYLKYTKEQY